MSDELADNLRRYRRAEGLSQEQLAHRADLSVGPVRRIEQGDDGVRMETPSRHRASPRGEDLGSDGGGSARAGEA
ncbi:helix-turn-helix transcriptional regulator [Streptomyces sp. NPDC056161]|uniref:helix-turn-helix transcriptional regulator n=1 Tax=Streptomyces sp. NPDC056161 TaxID=3345732 RepID=UPI0035D86A3C